METQIQNQNVTQAQEKKFLLRLVEAHGYNLHIWNTQQRKQLIIYSPEDYKLFERLLQYLQDSGKHRVFRTYYRPKNWVYDNDAWEMTVSAEELLSLLNINNYNKNSATLAKIKSFLSQ